jgi:hypothetical protein
MMGPTSEATSALHFSYINLKRFATNRIVDVVPYGASALNPLKV